MKAEIVVENLGVRFDLDRQKRPTTPALAHVRRGCSTLWGLHELSCHVPAGAGVALIGPNGVGKSTLLRVMAGVLEPDCGTIRVCGKVGSLLAVGAGLMPRLTGRENSLLLAVLAGMRRREARAALDEVRERSELGAAFERPVSTYSLGMRARLGFSVIEQTRPDILLLDEVHEAIDAGFKQHVESYAEELRLRGGIVIAAGHDVHELGRLADSAIRLGRSGLEWTEEWHPLESEAEATPSRVST